MQESKNNEEVEEVEVEKVELNDEKPVTPRKFSSPWHFSDVVLVVEGTKFHVHKSTLSRWSPVFETMFTSQFKERTEEEIPLPEKDADEMEQLLKVIYSDDAKQEITEKNYEFLLELASYFQMDKVLQHCRRYMGQGIDDQNCLHRYHIADRFGLEDVMEKCNKQARFKSSTDLEESEDFRKLGVESKFKLCIARVKELEEALSEYAEICSELVSGYYEKVSSETQYKNIDKCDNKSSHRSSSRWGDLLDFDSSCSFCRNRISSLRYRGNSVAMNVNAVQFDGLFIKLYDLEHDDKVEKIIQQMNADDDDDDDDI